jgi:hypothetical protein
MKSKFKNLNEHIDYNSKFYHGTGNLKKAVDALKNGKFNFSKTAGVEIGIYVTPRFELAKEYSKIADGVDKGVIEITLEDDINLKKYTSAKDAYEDSFNYEGDYVKDRVYNHKQNLILQGYDGQYTEQDGVYIIYSEKINKIKEIKPILEENESLNEVRKIIRKIINETLITNNYIIENIGPGPNDNRPMSNIFMDKFNQMFQSDDFKKEYNPSEYIFLDDEKEDIKNQNNLYDKEFKNISKKYRNFKRKKSWKNK